MKLLTLNFITPEKKESYKAKFISLEDKVGSLGIYPNHERYITVLNRSIGYFIDENESKNFFAYDYGILKVENNSVSIITRIFLKGNSVESLKEELEKKSSRIDIYEKQLRENIKILERTILKNIVEIERS
ncbi:F0F1 ATP synthase subunit epsilon [Hydrogenothermus marinus]|uniref:F-type H+-transporting ATPase subunit epsilon n=1 Tax=Hydrogenothermus marinus TaxID=133270 RepID=A0A3M0BLB6_9AQUI|nr:F0F1 ATP synthase subunit epsilon [Hydrogenothermus marinus]RMA97234.1 F-type H+-transporting ATPase subunit epsilon [Hydrogenothermus marinus]